MIRFFAVALLAGLAGCASPTLTLTPSPELADVTAWAVAQWREAGADIAIGAGGAPVVRVEPSELHERGIAQWQGTRHRLVVREGVDGDKLATTVLHELGHALGFPGHLREGLMAEYFEGPCLCVDDAAAHAVGLAHGSCELETPPLKK